MRKPSYFLLVSIALLAAISLFFFVSFLKREDRARIIFFDVGQGDAILITSPHGRNVLIDTGNGSSIVNQLSSLKKDFSTRIDLMIATHPDLDHAGGCDEVIDSYEVGLFLYSPLSAGSLSYFELAKKVRGEAIPHRALRAGDRIFLDDGMSLDVLAPFSGQIFNDANSASLVMALNYGGRRVLLTGDAPREVEQTLLKLYGNRLQSEVLKLGHHGSKTSSSASFLEEVNPRYAIISAGCENRFGHPHPSVMKRLLDYGIIHLNTCDGGNIVFVFEDGEWVLEDTRRGK